MDSRTNANALLLRLQLKTRLRKLFRILILQLMMRVFTLAVANVLAANRAANDTINTVIK